MQSKVDAVKEAVVCACAKNKRGELRFEVQNRLHNKLLIVTNISNLNMAALLASTERLCSKVCMRSTGQDPTRIDLYIETPTMREHVAKLLSYTAPITAGASVCAWYFL